MKKFCQAILDACPGALCLFDEEQRLIHANQALLATLPAFKPAVGWADALSLSGAASTVRLSDGSRFTLGEGEQLTGIQVRGFTEAGRDFFLVSATRLAAQRQLKIGLREMLDDVQQGSLDCRLAVPSGKGMSQHVGESVNQIMSQLQAQIRDIVDAVDALSGCDLRVTLALGGAGEIGRLRNRLSVTIANLTESIRQTIESSVAIADTTAEVARQNKLLSERTSAQADEVQTTSVNMEELSSAVANAAASAERADQQGRETNRLAEAGRETVNQVVEAMESINKGAVEVGEIICVINDIAFQTNILALNAAVEAARAGEHGRGFAIVAAEVRALAGRSAAAAKQIRLLIDRSADTAAEGKRRALDADERMREILVGVQTTSEQIAAISSAAYGQTQGIADANRALQKIDELTQQNNDLVANLAGSSVELDRQARYLTEAASIFHLPGDELRHPLHREAEIAAIEASRQVGEALEKAIQAGRIDEQQLFDYRYAEIPDTDPPKYSTPYDALTDRLLLPIQEALLEQHPQFVYAITADFNGYVPTHNKRFSQPLTGDYAIDLAGNRTKRIYSDRVGQQVGRHDQTRKLQTYRRDTGELMFDMSAPVHVNGRHWGGFRIGYRIE